MRAIDGSPFQAYRKIRGEHELGEFRLTVLSVPADALAGPARIRLAIDRSRAGLEGPWSRADAARVVLEDAIVRAAVHAIEESAGPATSSAPGSGRLWVAPAGADIVERTSATVDATSVSLTLSFDLPAVSRHVRGDQAATVLFERLPRIGMAALLFPPRRAAALEARVEALARHREASAALAARGLAAVIPEGSLPGRAVPPGLKVSIATSRGAVTGLGLPRGITLIVGGDVAGPGVWLRTLAEVPGTAPEDAAACDGPVARIRASGRALGPVDLSAFVLACPEAPRPDAYAAETVPAPLLAAAAVVEAVEAGAKVLLIDEDDLPAAALTRDGRMQRVLDDASTPLIPLIDRLADLKDRWDVSIVIAARALGDLCEAADVVLVLRDGRIEDATETSRRVTRSTSTFRLASSRPAAGLPKPRTMRIQVDAPAASLKVGVWGARGVRVGDDLIDLGDVAIGLDPARLRGLAALLKRAASVAATWRPVGDVLDALEAASARPNLDALEEPGLYDLARPTRLEIAEALVRWKRVAFRAAPVTLRAPAR